MAVGQGDAPARDVGNGWMHANGRFVEKLTPELLEKLRLALASGAPPAYAAPYVGVSRSTYYRWVKEGRRDHPDVDPIYRELVVVVEEAVSAWAVGQAAQITKAGAEDWRAAAYMLERRLPEDFGRRDRVEHGNVDGQPFKMLVGQVDLSRLSEDELDVLERLLERARPTDELPEVT